MKSREKHYFDYVDRNCRQLEGKTIAMTGATGGIGRGLARLLSHLGCRLILLVRSEERGIRLKKSLEAEFGASVVLIHFDYLDLSSGKKAVEAMNEAPFALVNIGGIYHQDEEFIDGIEKTFRVNLLAPVNLITLFHERFPFSSVVQVSSLVASCQDGLRPESLISKESFVSYLASAKGKNRRYALSKRLAMKALLAMEEEGLPLSFAHPGVTTSDLFSPRNKAYPKWFYKLVPPLMRIVFMDPEKASLSIALALAESLGPGKWAGPGGFLHAWGYPKIYPYDKGIVAKEENALLLARIREANGK